MDLGLVGKKVLITGATSGIGLATAKAFLHEGAEVFINGHNKERLNMCCQSLLEKYPNKVFTCLGDITKKKGVENAIAMLKSNTDYIDVAVMNLGNGKPNTFNYLDSDEWRRFYDINTITGVAMLENVYPLLKKGIDANVILISSAIARERTSAPIGYAAAKSAVLVLNKYLSDRWAVDGIRVNCVLPGNIIYSGGRWEELLDLDKENVEDYIHNNVSMKRFGRPEEIASAILFLSSDKASFITGTALNVDGGQQRTV